MGAGPQPAEGNPDLAPLSVEPTAGTSVERGTGAASRSSERVAPPTAPQEPPVVETAAEIAVVPAAQAAPTPPPLPPVTGQLWTTEAVNVRSAPSPDAERVATTEFGAAVDVTGVTEGDWSQSSGTARPRGSSRASSHSRSPRRPRSPPRPGGRAPVASRTPRAP